MEMTKSKPLKALCAGVGLTLLAATAHAQVVSEDGFAEIFDCSTVAGETERLACYDAAVGRLRAANSRGEIATIRRDDVAAVERDGFGFNLPAIPQLRGIFGGGKNKKKDKASEVAEVAPARAVERPDRITGKDALSAPVIRSKPSVPAPTPVEAVRVAEAQATAERTALPKPFESIDKVEIGLKKTKTLGYKKQRFYLENGQIWDQIDGQTVRLPKEKEGRTNTVEIRRAAMGSFLLRINGSGSAIRVRRRQ